MLQNLQTVIDLISNNNSLSQEEKTQMIASLKEADKKFSITEFKLDRTEKVKRTTAILLEETIEELEQKRKAVEAQNRELEIENALEKVRAIALSMNQPADMLKVCHVISEQLALLKVDEVHNVQTAIIHEDKGTYLNYEYYIKHDKSLTTEVDYKAHDLSKVFANKMLKGAGELFIETLDKKALDEWYAYQKTTNQFVDSWLEKAESLSYYFFSLGPVALGISTYVPLTDDNINLFKRFRNVFELAYRRFLDIQKAEAQAREAQIELALERVRARTMAMQHSGELADASFLLDSQVRALGIKTWGCAFNIYGENESTEWFSSKAGTMPAYKTPREKIFLRYYEAGQRGEAMHIEEYAGETCVAHYNYLCTVPVMGDALKEVIANGGSFPTCQIDHATYFKYGYLLFITFEPVPDAHDIFIRFAKVFEQTYTRFLDLQKAEAQAREAQIEAALERVRSRTMAMQHSDELTNASAILDQQVRNLGIQTWGCAFHIYADNEEGDYEWFSSQEGTLPFYKTPRENFFLRFYELGKSGADFHLEEFIGEACKNHYDYLMTIPSLGDALKGVVAAGGKLPTTQYDHLAFFRYGYILFITYEPVLDADDIFKRFAKVFEQTYTRFLDLQKAEAQAREAQIEAALERVRSGSLAMHKTSEIQGVIHTVHEELLKLNISIVGGSFIVINKDVDAKLFAWGSGGTADTATEMLVPDFEMPFCINLIKGIKRGGGFFTEEFSHQEKIEYFTELFKNDPWSKLPAKDKQAVLESEGAYTRSVSVSKHTSIFIINQNGRKFTEAENDIVKRFAKVFEQTYTRFLDLQKAEAQAREAQIEAALERVRSRTLAMQKSEELAETSAVLFKQLILLGISPNRLYISIIKDDVGNAEFWITDEDGGKVSMAYEDNLNTNVAFKKMYAGWKQQKKSLIIDMHGEELEAYFQHLSSIHVLFKGGLTQKRRLQHIAYFSKGFIGMASPDEQPAETLQLLERFAYVFNLTFTRFSDLKIAEAHALQAEQDLIEIKSARQKAENALSELQSTQKQLIQSEKMASLGELTAGIAHEIQNPLNFVNNFSEVSNELIDEINEEIERGNTKDVKVILMDIKQNLEKINHHGKRADAIVKGMLQHSRQTKSITEPTDINVLTDEYIRLCFHGLRAKDKSFNSNIQTDFDSSIENINIIPQDIGRVLLNVLTNAFYAVNEKKEIGDENYQPTVSVQTKKLINTIEIRVTDNGNGIPQNIIYKIFQPFFTTKPTGQGTGLGLSLSYDIIKAHGGEIKVETKEGEGTEFIIKLPV